jgi:DNA adenine methylase
VVRKFDAKDAVHFLDPPYTGYNAAVGEGDFDEQRFFNLVKGLQGKFLITYGVRGKLPKLLKAEGYPIKRIRTPRTLRTMRGVGGSKFLTQIVATNYDVAKKSLDELALDGWELIEEETPERTTVVVSGGGSAAAPPAPASEETHAAAATTAQAEESRRISAESAPIGDDGFTKIIPLIKGVDPSDERFVLGIVLEPETVDAQEDIYSSVEIRQAAHRFMEDFQDVGLMHKMRVNGEVKIVESYLAPCDLTVAGTTIKKGTWLLGVRVLSDALWKDVQEGRLTGFSIGGSARRVPEREAAPEAA